MTTVDQRSESDQNVLGEAIAPDAPVLDCKECGRNCRHVPASAGGGTAGGIKGERWTATPRSELRCPSCGGKLHRKESRSNQEMNCLTIQAGNALGLTVLPRPTAEVLDKMAELVRDGKYREPPQEREVAHLVAIASGLIPPWTPLPEIQRGGRTASKKVTTKAVPNLDAGEALTEGIEPGEPIVIPEDLVSRIKTRPSPEEIQAEKDRKAEEKAKAKAERDAARETAKKEAADERTRKAAERLEAKAKVLKDKAAGMIVTTSPIAVASPEAHAPIEVEEADENGTFADGYNPMVGTLLDTGEEDEDEEEDEEELTNAQIAALERTGSTAKRR